MAAWAPTPRVFASFRAAFPHVLEMKDRSILVGSPNPIPFEPEAWQRRALAPDVVAYLGAGRSPGDRPGVPPDRAPGGGPGRRWR